MNISVEVKGDIEPPLTSATRVQLDVGLFGTFTDMDRCLTTNIGVPTGTCVYPDLCDMPEVPDEFNNTLTCRQTKTADEKCDLICPLKKGDMSWSVQLDFRNQTILFIPDAKFRVHVDLYQNATVNSEETKVVDGRLIGCFQFDLEVRKN